MSKQTISIKVFVDSPDKFKKVQRIESYKQDKSLTVPEVLDMLAENYLKLNPVEGETTVTEK